MMDMMTKQILVSKLLDYMNGSLPLVELVDWAETILIDTPTDEAITYDVLAYVAAADVDGFPLGWSECHAFLTQLGAKVQVITPN